MAIQNLPSIDTLSGSDQIPVYSGSVGNDSRVSIAQLTEAVQDGFVPAGGLMALSSFYSMRKAPATPLTIAIGTSYQNFTDYDVPALSTPEGRVRIIAMTTLGEYVAQRDMAAVMFWVALTGAWLATRDLTLAVLIGPDATPYEAAARFVGAGRGAGNLVSPMFCSPAANRNNPGGVIRAGEKIRLVAKMNTADSMDLTRLTFYVQTLDGI